MTVLLADDDPITLDALHGCVAPEGFTALLARDGREALALWEKGRPDLLCLDIMMPHIDGYEVCRRVRAADSQIPVLFLSAKSEEIDVVVGLQLGADDFIRKPFGKHELLARIRAACAAPIRAASPRGILRCTISPSTRSNSAPNAPANPSTSRRAKHPSSPSSTSAPARSSIAIPC
jgi:DNA-binding response OmpR family regulator